MFLDVSMIFIPVMGMIYFVVWLTATYAANYYEDRCFFERAKYTRISALVLMVAISLIATMLVGNIEYAWVHPAVIMLAMIFPVLAFCILAVSGWYAIIAPLICPEKYSYDWDVYTFVTWFLGSIIVTVFLIVSCAAIFQWDWFFENCVSHEKILEYQLEYSIYLDEQASIELEVGELYGD